MGITGLRFGVSDAGVTELAAGEVEAGVETGFIVLPTCRAGELTKSGEETNCAVPSVGFKERAQAGETGAEASYRGGVEIVESEAVGEYGNQAGRLGGGRVKRVGRRARTATVESPAAADTDRN